MANKTVLKKDNIKDTKPKINPVNKKVLQQIKLQIQSKKNHRKSYPVLSLTL